MNRLSTIADLLNKAYSLAKPYGRKKLAMVFFWVFAQGIVQVVGVTSIFPFLAIAADPGRIRQAEYGRLALAVLPPMDNDRLLILSGSLAIVLLFFSNAINLLSEVARVRYGHAFGHWLRMRLLRQIASQPYGFFLQHNSSELLKKVASDVFQYVYGVLLPLLDSCARLLTVILLLLLVCIVNVEAAAFGALVLGGFYVLVFMFLNRRLTETSSGMKEAERSIWQDANQLLSGMKAVKAHQAEEFFIRRFAKHSRIYARLLTWVPVYSNGPRYLVEPLAFGGVVAIVLIRSLQGRELAPILPALGVFALAGYRLIPTLQLLYGQITHLTTMTHHLDEIYDEFVDIGHHCANAPEVFIKAAPFHWEHTLTLDHVTFAYPGSAQPVIDDISLTIAKSSSVGFVGRTGCGKSTLLDLLLGLHTPTSGRILIDGKELTAATRHSWLAGIGYVPQDIFLIDDTIAANIALGVSEETVDHDRLREVCTMAQLIDLIDHELPAGFRTMVGERGVRLSGGQRQRIGLARALYNRPQLLVLDEATSALDQSTEADLNGALEPLRGSLTMLIVAHRSSSVQQCNIVYTLQSGRIIAANHAALSSATERTS